MAENENKQPSFVNHKSNQSKLDLIHSLLKENHELKQVCLEVLRGLERPDRPLLIEAHWHSELNKVLNT